jgi:hypothetical protein
MTATLAIGTPSPVCSHAANANATGPNVTPAAPSAAEVWSGWAPWTLRSQPAQWPSATS